MLHPAQELEPPANPVRFSPVYVGRILIAAVETRLRPGDLQALTRSHIEETKRGQHRIILRTKKSRGKNHASIPVTQPIHQLLAELPADQENIIVSFDGKPFAQTDSLGQLVSEWRDALGIRSELRLYDARGTAVTRLVRAECHLSELASHMGWNLQDAAQMLDRYTALDPDMADGIREKVKKSERKALT